MIETGTNTFDRTFAVSAEQLWQLLTGAKEREAWGAPSDEHVLHVEASDLSEGGLDVHRCGPKENPEFVVETRWYRLEPPAHACFTETILFGGMRIGTSLVSYNLTEAEGGTALQVIVQTASFGGPDVLAEVAEGWGSALDRLDRLAAA